MKIRQIPTKYVVFVWQSKTYKQVRCNSKTTKMLRNAINFSLILVSILLIGFLISFFFLGSQLTYESQLEDLPNYFIRRFLGGITLGLILSVLILLVNILLNKILNDSGFKLFKLFLISFISASISSLIGTIIFFNNWLEKRTTPNN